MRMALYPLLMTMLPSDMLKSPIKPSSAFIFPEKSPFSATIFLAIMVPSVLINTLPLAETEPSNLICSDFSNISSADTLNKDEAFTPFSNSAAAQILTPSAVVNHPALLLSRLDVLSATASIFSLVWLSWVSNFVIMSS